MFPKTFGLFDLGAIVRRYYHAAREQARDWPVQMAIERIAADAGRVEKVIVCADHPPYFRAALDPAYKANRPEKDDEIKGLMRAAARAAKERWPLVHAQGFEADDMIASIVHALIPALDAGDVERIEITTGDTDLLSLLRPGVVWRRVIPDDEAEAHQREEILHDHKPLHKKCPVLPHQVVDFKMLTGDDGVKYFPGIGEKRAADLIEEFGSFDAIAAQIDDFEPGSEGQRYRVHPPKLRETIKNALTEMVQPNAAEPPITKAELARLMITLRTDAPFDPKVLEAGYEPKPAAAASPKLMEEKQPEPAQARMEHLMQLASAAPVQIVDAATIRAEQRSMLEKYRRELEPRNFEDLKHVATILFESRLWSNFIQTNGGIATFATAIMMARSKKVDLFDFLNGCHIINGKLVVGAHVLVGMVKRSPRCEYFYIVESTTTRALVEVKQRKAPKPERYEYTIEEAQEAKRIVPNSAWQKDPKAMLLKTACARAARGSFQDVIGAAYAPEEIGDEHLSGDI